MVKKGVQIVLALITGILLISLVSAGMFDWLKITSYASNQPTNVSISLKGTNPAIVTYVSPITAVDPIPNSSVIVNFTVQVFDQDGMNDVNRTSVTVNFTNGGEARYTGSYCTWVNNIAPRTANFTCSITMWYWDNSGTWNINARATDLGNLSWAYNTTTSFTYNLLKDMVITPPALTWASLNAGATNQLSNNDPTIISNRGNFNGTVQLTALDLIGETDAAYNINASNFTANPADNCAGTQLQSAVARSITGADANRGNLSAGQGIRNIYYCIPNVPTVSTQTYSTVAGGSWTILY